MKPKNTQMVGESPIPIESTPNTSDDTMIMPMRLRLAKNDATTMPPSTMPTLNEISSTARLIDVLLLAGVERAHEHERREVGRRHVSTKMIANSTSSQRTNAWCAT